MGNARQGEILFRTLTPTPVKNGQQLSQLLMSRGMTLSDLARDAGISYNAAVRLINGKDRDTFKLSVLKKVASVLGVTPFQLIDPSLDSSVGNISATVAPGANIGALLGPPIVGNCLSPMFLTTRAVSN